ncbi:MAG TPA: chloride channel protein [Bacteroidia bacterium]|nr:chloride channel protein [Bacteroidia bacterium]
MKHELNIQKINYVEKGINWLHSKFNEKQFLIFSSILVGLSSGLAAVILKLFVHFIRHYVIEKWLLTLNFKYIYLLLPVIGIGLTVFIVQRFFKGKLFRGTVNILHSIAKKGSFLSFQQMYSHIITSGFTVAFGGSAGLESPIVSTGAAIGSNYARRYKLSYKERTLLLAAGAAGGIAGAFNSPIAGVLFALEVILVDITITAFIPLLIAAASGALISKIILQENILLSFRLIQPFNYYNLPYYIVLGVLAGFMSLYYVNTFDKTESRFKKIKAKYKRWIIGSLLLVILFAFFPSLFGEGYDNIKSLAEQNSEAVFKESIILHLINHKWLALLFLIVTLFLKSFAAGITLGSGGNGGNFAPSLFVGAFLGYTFSYLLELLGFKDIPISNLTIVAMAGILTGVFHAPLTGIFLIAEITGGYELIIPLMIVSCISYIVVKYFHPQSMEIKKLMKKGTIVSEDKDVSILGKIDILSIIETDFSIIHPENSLREIVEVIKLSKRNTFPVVNKNNKLVGILLLDNIRQEIFNQDLYDKVSAKELMMASVTKIRMSQDIFAIMKIFEESGQWNLPVVDKGIYVGFLSKSSILTKYRNELVRSI